MVLDDPSAVHEGHSFCCTRLHLHIACCYKCVGLHLLFVSCHRFVFCRRNFMGREIDNFDFPYFDVMTMISVIIFVV